MVRSFAFLLFAFSNVFLPSAANAGDFLEPAREGGILCAKLSPKADCFAHASYTFKDAKIYEDTSVIFTLTPPITASASTTYDDNGRNDCLHGLLGASDSLAFHTKGAPLSDIELQLFKAEWFKRIKGIDANMNCLIPVETADGPAYEFRSNGVKYDSPPIYLSWHSLATLPPLIEGAHSTIVKQ
jgi:hypothetical protein